MGAAAAQRVATAGYARVPNSLIENQAIFTHAELALALIVLRRGGADAGVPVSDRNWQGWTGLSPRAKEYAIKGLREKCLEVDGRGDKARYTFRREQWETFVRHSQRSKPRTAGRAEGVKPKKGAKVHPACRENGCAMMAAEAGSQNALTLVAASSLAQPVAQTCTAADPAETSNQAAGAGLPQNGLSLVPASSVAQPVAQISRPGAADAIETVWALTLAKLREYFPLVGVVFLARLLAVVCAVFRGVTDSELALAVESAWKIKRKVQKAEGLFLLTVPEALAALRRAPKPPPAPDMAEGAGRLLERVAGALKARGAPFDEQHAAVCVLLDEIRSGAGVDLERLEASMTALEASVIESARASLTEGERRTVEECVAAALDRDCSRMSGIQREQYAARARERETLTVLAIPRLSLFYV